MKINLVSGRIETFDIDRYFWDTDMGILFIYDKLSVDECNRCIAVFAAGQWESLFELDEPY